jgi:short-subunit dehydrogenase
MMKRILIVGGANGIGLGIATALAEREEVEKVYIIDKKPVDKKFQNEKFKWYYFNLDETNQDKFFDRYMFFDRFTDIDGLIITAGFGSLKLFKDVEVSEIDRYFRVNTIPTLRLIKKFYNRLDSKSDFYCGVMVSIAGHLSSPWLSVYGATKAALKSFIASVNATSPAFVAL